MRSFDQPSETNPLLFRIADAKLLGRHAFHILENPREIALVAESATGCDLCEWQLTLDQHLAREVNPALAHEFGERTSGSFLEEFGEVAG